jgi:lysophospholipase L1-like esterase
VNCVVSGDYSPLVTTGLPSYYPSRKDRLAHVDFSMVDTVLLYYGTNDYMSGVSEVQVMACAEYIKTLQVAFPQIKVIYCSPAYRVFFDGSGNFDKDSNTYNPSKGTLIDYCRWYEAMAKSINISFIDCYNIGINIANYSRYFTSPDGVHHNANGRKLLGEYIGRRMLTV